MFLEAVCRMARCLDCTSIHQRLAKCHSTCASGNGPGEVCMQFAGRCCLGVSQIFISG